MKNSSNWVLGLVLFVIVVFFVVVGFGNPVDDSLHLDSNRARISDGSTMMLQSVLYYHLYVVHFEGDLVTVTSLLSSTYTLCDPDCTEDIPLLMGQTLHVEKLGNVLVVDIPFAMLPIQ
ncbi:TPA: hypothetical protein DCZ81_04035 [Candidatus Collierbacteria bacterium]|nr:MAG: hypothetical protein UW48_C0009G0025 [Microgenomates group bacterium GW2011_GWC1_44_23]KKT94926.1 MAG: hypothetical protein UW96_C0013G0027 [Candidatus Collierbacteria bacterium GW2011_GWA1_45_15]HBC45310.1 hypothetical protein [Candidatus Collierbacteria bacterium]